MADKQIIFLPHQREFLESVASEVIQSGAFGSSKTVSLCEKIVFLSLRYPRNRGYLCRKTLQSLKSTTLKTLLDGDGGMPAILPKRFIRQHNRQDRVITLINESEIWYGPMDKEFIKSMNLGWAAVDELSELTEEDWNLLSGRLRLSDVPIRQIFGATNPASPKHWIYNRAVANPLKDKNGNNVVHFISSKTEDNIYLPPEYIENLKRTLFGFYYKRFVEGIWCGTDDLVYDNFDLKHIIKPFNIPNTWKRFRSVDFGYRSPFSCLWFAICGNDAHKYNSDGRNLQDGDLIVYREMYYTQRITSMNAKKMNEFSKYPDNKSEKVYFTVADWDAGDRADLESEGIRTIKANKDITLGIQKVRERLGNNDPTRGEIVRASLYFFENSLIERDPKIKTDLETGERNNNPDRLVEEFMAYAWKEGKEEPIDDFNHALDALRYGVMAHDLNQQWVNIPFEKV